MEAAAKCFAFLSPGFNDIEWPGRLTLKSKKQDKHKMMDVKEMSHLASRIIRAGLCSQL